MSSQNSPVDSKLDFNEKLMRAKRKIIAVCDSSLKDKDRKLALNYKMMLESLQTAPWISKLIMYFLNSDELKGALGRIKKSINEAQEKKIFPCNSSIRLARIVNESEESAYQLLAIQNYIFDRNNN